MLKKSIYSLLVLALCGGVTAGVQAGNSPLNFSYRVVGSQELRPLMVFNDGSDTFIQPQSPEEKGVLVNGLSPIQQGPYFVVHGVVGEITLSQGGKNAGRVTIQYLAQAKPSVSIVSSLRKEPVTVDVAPSPSARKEPALVVSEKPPVETKRLVEKSCIPSQDRRDSAFVATFSPGTSVLSKNAVAEVKKLVGDTGSISSVEVIGEGTAKVPARKRASAIKTSLVATGIDASKIDVSEREMTGIGSEIHIHRVVEIPCGASVVKVTSRKGLASIVWDRDVKELAQRIASDLKVDFSVTGPERLVPVRVSVIDMPFPQAMYKVGSVLPDGVDLILRPGELILSFKEKQ